MQPGITTVLFIIRIFYFHTLLVVVAFLFLLLHTGALLGKEVVIGLSTGNSNRDLDYNFFGRRVWPRCSDCNGDMNQMQINNKVHCTISIILLGVIVSYHPTYAITSFMYLFILMKPAFVVNMSSSVEHA